MKSDFFVLLEYVFFGIVSKEYVFAFATFCFCINSISHNPREPGEAAKIMFTVCIACGFIFFLSSENSPNSAVETF